MKSRTFLFHVAALFFVTGIVACLPGETVEVTYNNVDDAAKAGAIERGWIPAWLPKTAVDLHEKHNLDSNTGILRFSLNISDLKIPSDCQETTGPLPATLSADWWPADLHQTHTVFRCAGGYIAVDEKNGHVYLWRP